MIPPEAATAAAPAAQTPPGGGAAEGVSLAKRLVSSALLISLVLATLFVFPLWVFVVVVTAFILAGLYEFFTMVRHRGILVHRPLSLLLGLILTALVAWRALVAPGLMPTPILGPQAGLISLMWDLFWPATIVVIFVRQLTRENTFEALSGLATTLFGLAYVAALFSYLFYLRAMDPVQGAWLVCFLILVTKMGDAGAYFIGRFAGRSPLVPRISPRKTIEGAVGGILTAGVVALLARGALGRPEFGPGESFVLGCALGICGQLGDLAESLLKRDCQVKDTGAIMPGLGGVLDVLDSLLFTAPLFYGILIYG